MRQSWHGRDRARESSEHPRGVPKRAHLLHRWTWTPERSGTGELGACGRSDGLSVHARALARAHLPLQAERRSKPGGDNGYLVSQRHGVVCGLAAGCRCWAARLPPLSGVSGDGPNRWPGREAAAAPSLAWRRSGMPGDGLDASSYQHGKRHEASGGSG